MPGKTIITVIGLFLTLTSSQSMTAGEVDDVPVLHAIQAPLASKSLLLDVFSVNNRKVAVGERGHILVSENGEPWQQSDVPTQSMLTGVYFHDEQHGWAVGHDAVIVATSDGGVTWQLQNYEPELETPFLDVWFSDAENGLAIGAYGLYFRTDDAGTSWSEGELIVKKELQDDDPESAGAGDFAEFYELHLNDISESSDGTLYIAAEAGRIYRSDDQGETWVELVSPYVGSFFGVLPLQDESLLVFGLRGHLFRSEDRGQSWQAIETNTNEMLTNGIQLVSGQIVIVGLGGTILVSEDGKTFASQETGTRTGFSAVINGKDDALTLVGENGIEPFKIDNQ